MEVRKTFSKAARVLVAGALVLGSLAAAAPARAHVVEVTTSLDVPDAQDGAAVKAALHRAVERVLAETIAFKPTMVALTDARVMGEKLLVRLLIADAEGEQMLKELQGGDGSASPDLEDPDQPGELKV